MKDNSLDSYLGSEISKRNVPERFSVYLQGKNWNEAKAEVLRKLLAIPEDLMDCMDIHTEGTGIGMELELSKKGYVSPCEIYDVYDTKFCEFVLKETENREKVESKFLVLKKKLKSSHFSSGESKEQVTSILNELKEILPKIQKIKEKPIADIDFKNDEFIVHLIKK